MLVKIRPVHFHMDAPEYVWINPKYVLCVVPASPNGEDVSQSVIYMAIPTDDGDCHYTMRETATEVATMLNVAMERID